jgi:hypothetical protein
MTGSPSNEYRAGHYLDEDGWHPMPADAEIHDAQEWVNAVEIPHRRFAAAPRLIVARRRERRPRSRRVARTRGRSRGRRRSPDEPPLPEGVA